MNRLQYVNLRTLPRLVNWKLRKNSEYAPHPLQAKVEITRRCNLDCAMCIRPHLPSYQDMTFTQFKQVLDDLKGIVLFSPHGYGEPLMHQQFLEFMREVHRRHIHIVLVTNGTLLTRRISKQFLFESNPLKITFSVDAGRKESYEKIRRGADFDVLTDNIAAASVLRRKLRVGTKLELYCTLGTYNLDQIEPMAILADMTRMDQLTFCDLTLHGYGLAQDRNAIRNSAISIDKQIRKLRLKYPHIKISHVTRQASETSCAYPWQVAVVYANGDMHVCCDTHKLVLGNMFKESFADLWNGDTMRAVRRNFLTNPPDECWKCVNHAAKGENQK